MRSVPDLKWVSLTRSSAVAVIADRTACSILTLFIVTATSRPLNKKSVCCQSADATITADLRPQSAVLCLHLQSAQPHRPWSAVTLNGTVSLLTTSRITTWVPYTQLWRVNPPLKVRELLTRSTHQEEHQQDEKRYELSSWSRVRQSSPIFRRT